MKLTKKQHFIRVLSEFLSKDAAQKSIELQMGKPHAMQWAELRSAGPSLGYADVDETEKQLTEFLK